LTRKLIKYPPFCDICMVGIQALDENAAITGAMWVLEKIKNLLSFWDLPPPPENRAVMWKNVVQPDMSYGACTLHTGYLSLQAHTKICNIHCFSTATMIARTRLNVTLYVHCFSC